MDNMYEAQTLNNLNSENNYIEKINKEDEAKLFSKKDLTGTELEKTTGMFEQLQEHSSSIHKQTKEEYKRLWQTDNATEMLLENAQRYDLSKNNELHDTIVPELLELSKIDSHRPVKSRKKYIKNASESYKRAAKSMQKFEAGKKNNRAWMMVENGEAAILAVYEAEKSLLKAGGIYDINEKMKVARNYAKCQDMLRRFYKDCLSRDDINLTDKERKTLQKKLIQVRKNGMNAQCRIVACTLKTVPSGKDLAGDFVMSKMQFLSFINKANKENIPEDIKNLADALQEYESNKADIFSEDKTEQRRNIAALCESVKENHPGKLKLHVAINILKEQIIRASGDNAIELKVDKKKKKGSAGKTDEKKITQTKEKKQEDKLEGNDKINAELLKDDLYADYGYMTDNDFNTMSSKNKGNTVEAGKWIRASEDGLIGYLKTGNCSMINHYLRSGKIHDDIINMTKQKDSKLTQKKWKDDAENTILHMQQATHDSVLKKNTRLIRMVSPDFFNYALKMDKKLLPNEGEFDLTKAQKEQITNEAQKYIGTVVTDKAFMSTGAKADMPFFHLPVMMTLLCEKGQKCFVTDNKVESEVILPKNSKYVIMGVVNHADKAKRVPTVVGDNLEQNIKSYNGIELICKLVTNADELVM